MSNPLNSFIHATIITGVLLISLVGLFVVGPFIEGKYFPVTTGVTVVLMQETPEKMLFSAKGTKVRNCSLIDARALVYTGHMVPPAKGAIYVIDDGVGGKTRALGYQDLGVWAIHPSGNKIVVQSTYSCHKLWNTEQNLGEWQR